MAPAALTRPGTGRSEGIDMAQPRSIRDWLEETADQLMRDGNATVTCPSGVTLRREQEIKPVPLASNPAFDAVVPGMLGRVTFVAELENGNTIETTRG
jgi:hypothetical protein